MALQRMGLVGNYEAIRDKSIAIVGVGGVGSVAAEMLTRCGIGRLQLYDFDVVELANMNRLFFRPVHAGMMKTDAAVATLQDINPDVEYEAYHINITSVDGFSKFIASLKDADGDHSRVDLVLSCVDNYEARMCVNQACLEMKQTWMESGVSEDAMSGHIQLIVPGETACFACVPPLIVASGVNEATLKREGVCAASLPTTMGMVAGMLVQNSLKYLLKFGQVSHYLGYSALKDYFPTMEVKANVECSNPECLKRQREYRTHVTSPEHAAVLEEARLAKEEAERLEKASPLHEENTWEITCEVGEDIVVQSSSVSIASFHASGGLVEGVEFSMPHAQKLDEATVTEFKVQDTGEQHLSDLMAQLKGLSR
jgi:ubiquitin-like modifier-activating enzyme 5